MAQIPMYAQLYVGRGLNSASGRTYAVAIDFDKPEPVTVGQNVVLTLESVTSSRELTRKLNIDASASIGAGGWGVSAEFSLAQSLEVNSYYTYALVRAVVTNPPQLLRNPRLKPEARAVLESLGWEGFSAVYGWEYVEGYISGGSYYALVEIQTTSETQQSDIKAKLGGFYGPFRADASLQTALQDISRTTVTNVFVSQNAGSGDVIETSLDEMVNQARNFPKLVKDSPVPIIALTADYQATVSLPSVPAQDSLTKIQQKNTLEDLGREYLKLRDYKSNLQFILDHLTEFDDFRDMDAAQLRKKRQDYQDSLVATVEEVDTVVARANNCATDYKQCQTYVPTIQYLPLPKIGGQLMTLKQIEEKLAALEQELGQLRGGSKAFRRIVVNATQDGERDPSSNMVSIQSAKQQPPYSNPS